MMQSHIYTLFGYHFYSHGYGLIIVIPAFLWFTYAIIRRFLLLSHQKNDEKRQRLLMPALFFLISFVTVFGDVIWLGVEYTRLCNKISGFRVIKTVTADGFVGTADIEHWSQYGYKYVEFEYYGRGKHRYEMHEGVRKKIAIEKFSARYAYEFKSSFPGPHFTVLKGTITDTVTSEVVGEFVVAGVRPGWVDRICMKVLGHPPPAPNAYCCAPDAFCNGGAGYVVKLITSVIKPVGSDSLTEPTQD
ncbi:MAG: hypothetical protein GY706_01985 [Bacteroides sp.]|nr:hypothetical protein [Bacteroides sp.]